ncbi:MAG TPA: nucleoside triphosphate pyrophosphohydrolase [Bacteroidetes bacterium]|nr:MAG: nucleoside triphosphate pyrophosphohydrolase [Ignavibacteria bacterium GWC2_56_12]HAV23056.1 nucleoside triphosphate pyrophosphohydrolase [Bacteroidota bacterium]
MNQSVTDEFRAYVEVVRRLRKECPWDREQTHASLKYHLLEEAYEALEAIDHGDIPHLREELGDLLLHVTLHAVIAEESDAFDLADVLRWNRNKLVRRHPHVFGEATFAGTDEVKRNWERTKMSEGRRSVTDGLPAALPALLRAHRLQEKVSKVGFDWNRKEDVWSKVEEELRELHEAENEGNSSQIEEEFGDVLFSLVNYARYLSVQPEEALRRSVEKFSDRFRVVEDTLREQGRSPEQASLEEMDRIWESTKRAPGA